MRRVLLPVAAAALGVATAVAATALHDRAWGWWILAVAASLAVALAVPAGWSRIAYGAGWLLVVWQAANPRPEGDYLVSSGARGLAYLAVALLLLVVCLVTIPVRRGRDESGRARPGT